MMRTIADWIWRGALLAALVWVGAELHGLRLNLEAPPVVDETVASSSGDVDQDSLDAIRDDVAEIKQKVNAIMVVMARGK
jgi:hypothetical protein